MKQNKISIQYPPCNYKIVKSVKYKTFNNMINQITCNSNNAIELSRGQLLNWVNSLLKLNYSKIEQLGTGAVYCQLLDLIYPGKVPLSKVNWKAKFDYEFVNNFKVLQQSFTKLNIMKHIDVQKLVKCKYQDNLQFLQWFKKIFDTTGSNTKDYDPITRRGDKYEKQKQNKNPVPLLHHNLSCQELSQHSKQGSNMSSQQTSKQSTDRTMQQNQIYKQQQVQDQEPKIITVLNQKIPNKQLNKYQVTNPQIQKADEKLIHLLQENQNQEKQFYLRKIKQIQYLMDSWDLNKKSEELIENIRKVILATPEVSWSIQNGEFAEQSIKSEQKQMQQNF